MMKPLFSISKTKEYRNPVFLIGVSFLKLYLVIGLLLRIVLMCSAPTDADFSEWDVVRALGIGVLSDLGMGLLLTIPLMLFYPGLNQWKYRQKPGWAIWALLLMAWLYALMPWSIFYEYGGGAPRIAQVFLGWKVVSFGLRLLVPSLRERWRRYSLYLTWAVYVFGLLLVSVGEYLFWQEFGVRYNFIAVDYLVYTHEVIGNILESYAVGPFLAMSLAATAAIIVWQSRTKRFKAGPLFSFRLLLIHYGLYLILVVTAFGLTSFTHNLQCRNQYVAQIEQNGAYCFVAAFNSNHLEYDRFYPMMAEADCKQSYLRTTGLEAHGLRQMGDSMRPQRANIVLITVESLSADFMTRYGNTQNLTPGLDSLAKRSMVFDSLYACGNRTVRGLEALSLCIPPSAGESIIKQKHNRMGCLSVGNVMRKLGYEVQFLYGGDSYFDNMGDYFSHNGYQVMDRASMNEDEISFSNIWGVCDGDLFCKAIKVLNEDARSGKPFFAQIMTTSNHRPYTYPEGKIQVNGDPHTREAAVRYTDVAISEFVREAQKQPWFANTVFVIVADHCASSAGKTSLPIERYHIPCLIYSPQRIHPQVVNKVCSQIDVIPTLLSMLHLPAQVAFAGQDVLSPSFKQRAFMATYQDLGYYEDHCLTVLSPVKRTQQYGVTPLPDHTFSEALLPRPRPNLIHQAETFYQYVNLYLKKW